MAEQLTLGGGSNTVDVRRRRLGLPDRYLAVRPFPYAMLRELDAIVSSDPVSWPDGGEGVALFDVMPPATEARVREWAAKYNVRLWEGGI